MKKRKTDNVKLGIFVSAGLAFLILSLYMVGKNQMLFGHNITLNARFHNVNGLVAGNNVRYGGIDIGTVKKVEIETDSSIRVTMLVDREMRKYIRQNALASIGTDGLMGDKLVNINSMPGEAGLIVDGFVLQSRKAIETDEMLRTLNSTNDNIAVITTNLKSITGKLNSSNSLWNLLSDSTLARNLKLSIANLRVAGANAAQLTAETARLVHHIREGRGVAGALLTDTVLERGLTKTLADLGSASAQAAALTSQLNEITRAIRSGEGTAGKIISDTTTSRTLSQILINLQEGTDRFNQNMEALKHNFLFRGYFRREERRNQKEKQEAK